MNLFIEAQSLLKNENADSSIKEFKAHIKLTIENSRTH